MKFRVKSNPGSNQFGFSQIRFDQSGEHAWADVHVVVPFVSDTLGSMSGKSAATLCRVACCQAKRETIRPLGFECSHHRQTLRPTIDGTRSKDGILRGRLGRWCWDRQRRYM
jgi:hypothetical protein